MIEEAGKKHYSLTLAAIEYKKKFPYEKFNKPSESREDSETYRETMERYAIHEYFKEITFLPDAEEEKIRSMKEMQSMKEIPFYSSLDYFWSRNFDA